jgi:plasmid stabilization system protein ParE
LPNVFFRKSAARELEEAQSWYESQRSGLGAEFARSLEAVVHRIARQPEGAPLVWEDVRRAHLKRFPYSIFYIVEAERVVVLSCQHQRRDPAGWPPSSASPSGGSLHALKRRGSKSFSDISALTPASSCATNLPVCAEPHSPT